MKPQLIKFLHRLAGDGTAALALAMVMALSSGLFPLVSLLQNLGDEKRHPLGCREHQRECDVTRGTQHICDRPGI